MNARLIWMLLVGSSFLDPGRASAGELGTRSTHSEFYGRQTNRFAQVWLFKPSEPKTADLGYTLAPLILQEVANSGPRENPPVRFGELGLSNGVPGVGFDRPSVYLKADVVTINGKDHARFTYLWFYTANAARISGEPLPVQGFRMTLDMAGNPAVWEVLAEPPNTRLIFVARSVEALALAQYGPPLRGRHYAVERDLLECPQVVVPRVLEDGPVAMGPIIYLNAESRAVVTLICRCMPAQAERLVGTSLYELVPTDGSPVERVLAVLGADDRKLCFGIDSSGREQNLGQLLRLPRSF